MVSRTSPATDADSHQADEVPSPSIAASTAGSRSSTVGSYSVRLMSSVQMFCSTNGCHASALSGPSACSSIPLSKPTCTRQTSARPLRQVFLIPGSTLTEAAIALARTVVRRAQRHTVRAGAVGHPVSDDVRHYLNRLSDLLYVVARHMAGPEAEPASHD